MPGARLRYGEAIAIRRKKSQKKGKTEEKTEETGNMEEKELTEKKEEKRSLKENIQIQLDNQDSFLRFVADVLHVYTSRDMTRVAASLSYYLMFTFFPLLILVNAILGLLNIDSEEAFSVLTQFLPSDVADLITDYLAYVGQNNSIGMLIASILLILTTASAAFRVIANTSYEIYQIKTPLPRKYYVITLFMPLILVVVIYVSGIFILTGNWFFSLIESLLVVEIRTYYWQWIRFLLLFIIVYAFLMLLYRVTLPDITPRPIVKYGAFIATVALVIVSVIFSAIMGASTKYSLVYGSLTAMILLMLWLFVVAIILLVGSDLNYVVYKHRMAQMNGEKLGEL